MALAFSHASLDQVLLWYDGPQVVLLKADDLHYVIAVAADEEAREDLFFGALVNLRQLADYQAERFDLRYLLTHPGSRKWYLFSLDDDKAPQISLRSINRNSPLIKKYLPLSGFFARAHEEIRAAKFIAPSATERFDIDGSWDLGEFSSFYGQVEDIYYLFNSMEKHADPKVSDEEKRRVEDALLRPFQGGGSYLGFYGDIANDNDRGSQLRVSGIQYNSPGFVEVKAKQKPFDDMIGLLRAFSDAPMQARAAYRALYQYLSENRLLKAPANTYIIDDVVTSINSLSHELATALRGVNFSEVFVMSRRNSLVAAKILLSIHRRTERLYKFFEQGRVKHAHVQIDPLHDI